jgi:hypothetical protein
MKIICENHCPECHSTQIEWSTKDIQDDIIYQNARCMVCLSEFTEIWLYHHTEIDSE